ncbi:type VI secretion system contractile sheath domain-containing protein [Roseomonas sp. BN140053]|uniref:type VI secretion system contractile sheath domain-containing protein n=1 Tax=Roseomonas sp. BN140053 TaxID=3391898 RepID=UPI0039E95EBD
MSGDYAPPAFPSRMRTRLLRPAPNGSGEDVELPFVIGLIADLSGGRPPGERPPLRAGRFTAVGASGPAVAEASGAAGAAAAGLDALLAGPAPGPWVERARRGLHFLAAQLAEPCRLMVLDATREELVADLAAGRGGALFRAVCEQPFAAGGGAPFTLLLADYAWDQPDADALRALAQLGAEAHAPVLTNAAEPLFRDGAAGTAWEALRQAPESRYLVLAAPPLPVPGGGAGAAAGDGMGAAHAVAARLARLHAATGWVAGLLGPAPDAWSPQLPTPVAAAEPGPVAAEAGLLPVSLAADGRCFLRRAPTLHRPRRYEGEPSTESARIAAQLPFVLATGRVMQSLRVLARDQAGRLDGPQLEDLLARWLERYRQDPDLPLAERRIRTPLHEVRLTLRPDPGGGQLLACHLRPWLGPEEIMPGGVSVMGRLP